MKFIFDDPTGGIALENMISDALTYCHFQKIKYLTENNDMMISYYDQKIKQYEDLKEGLKIDTMITQ